MAFIEWTQSYSVGIKMIDAQHKKLFSLINDFHDAKERGENDFNILDRLFLGLKAYVDFHFKTEEGYFDEFHYELTEEHTRQHKFYADKIDDFYEKFSEKGEPVTDDLMDFLKDWISSHIKIIDKKYQKCFNEHGLI